ncbi:MAG: DNA replication/repair protein RecF [bacterium]
MYIGKLTLSQFRQFTYETFEFDPSLTYVQGDNATGKTTQLEAIRYLSTGRSFRTHRDQRVIQHGTHSFSVRGEFSGNTPPISLHYKKPEGETGQKTVKQGEQTLDRLSRLRHEFPTVLFTPSHLDLLERGPSGRRSFLNELLSFIDPKYVDRYSEYKTYLDRRNALLKKKDPDTVLIDQFEEKMSEQAQYIIRCRKELIPRLKDAFLKEVKKVLDESAPVDIHYEPDVEDQHNIRDQFQSERSQAFQRGFTTIGPQRDDFKVVFNDRPANRYASRGQLRALVYALKMAESYVKINHGERSPVHLFDHLSSELDTDRFERCIQRAQEDSRQWVLTGTESFERYDRINQEQVRVLNSD